MTETFLDMAKRHKASDMLAKGAFEFDVQACSVGCFNHDLGQEPGDFKALAEFSGYPEWAHRLQEAVFEGLSESDSREWHVQFAEKAETVTDWDAHYHKTMIGILEVAKPHDPSGVVQRVIDLHKRGASVSQSEWEAAREAAWAAARAAAGAAQKASLAAAREDAGAARAAREAARAAREAARAATGAAREAAWAAAARDAAWAAAARAAAQDAAYIKIRDAFLAPEADQ